MLVFHNLYNSRCGIINYGLLLLTLQTLTSCSPVPFNSSVSACNCIPISTCKSIHNFIFNQSSETSQRDNVYQQIQNVRCGLGNSHECCPNIEQFIKEHKRIQKRSWVWGRKSLAEVKPRFIKQGKTEIDTNFNVLDYKDALTQRNCPEAFFEESSNDHHENIYMDKYYNHFHHYHPHFKYHIGDWSHDYDDDNLFYNQMHNHRPLVYPNDRRIDKPIIFPKDDYFLDYPITKDDRAQAVTNSSQCGILDAENQLPWIIRIAYLNTTANKISYRCSGSVISNLHIITAAHCVVNLVKDLQLSHIRIGDTEIKQDCEGSSCSAMGIFEITDILIHPNYDQPKFANDIAVLKFMRPPNIQVSYSPICLPSNTNRNLRNELIGTKVVVAGWSSNSEGSMVANALPSLRILRLPIVNTTECAITYAKYSENFNDPIVITPAQICALGDDMNDVCLGDSGGPLMDDGTSGLININGQYTLLGIVAFGPSTCGIPNFPAVYMRVTSYVTWIREMIK